VNAPSPFLILALPRSRTAWISKFLTYGEWHCGHEQLRYMRSIEDVISWHGMGEIGTAETAAAPHWRLALALFPDLNIITIRRDRREVLDSFARMGIGGEAPGTMLERLDRKLDQIERRGPNVTAIDYHELDSESGAKRLWESTLPYPFDREWYSLLAPLNIQLSLPHLLRYYSAHESQIVRFAAVAKETTKVLIREAAQARRYLH